MNDGVCLLLGGVNGSILGAGKHTITVQATLSNGIIITEDADWNIIAVD